MNTKNRYILVMIGALLILTLPNICAVPICWDRVICESSGVVSNGSIIYIDYTSPYLAKEEYCTLDGLNAEVSANRVIEIVIHQGQYQGGDSDIKRVLVDNEFVHSGGNIAFKLSKDTSPTTIICNDIFPSAEPGRGYEVIRSLKYWSASYDQQWFANSGGLPDYSYTQFKYALDENSQNTIDFVDTNISKSYNNYPATMGGNWLIFTLAIFLFIIGLLLLIQTVIGYMQRR